MQKVSYNLQNHSTQPTEMLEGSEVNLQGLEVKGVTALFCCIMDFCQLFL